jgi:heme A synthase
MKNPWQHRCAVILAVLTLIIIALGASLTSEIRPLPGSAATALIVADPSLEQAHRIAGIAVALLTFGLAIWISSSGGPRLTGWIAVAAVIVESVSGGVPVIHALIAPILFSLIVVVAVLTSASWQTGPRLVECEWGPLRPLGIVVPILIVMQIGLGAAFRHNAMGVISHILNALVVLTVVLIAGVFVVRQYPEHPSLRTSALALLIVTGIQVLLGFSVYLVLLMSSENNAGLIVTGVLHVVNGSLTLAASVVLAMQMHRNLNGHSPAMRGI